MRAISKPLFERFKKIEDNMNQDFRKSRLSNDDLELSDQAYTLLTLLRVLMFGMGQKGLAARWALKFYRHEMGQQNSACAQQFQRTKKLTRATLRFANNKQRAFDREVQP